MFKRLLICKMSPQRDAATKNQKRAFTQAIKIKWMSMNFFRLLSKRKFHKSQLRNDVSLKKENTKTKFFLIQWGIQPKS